MSIGTINIDLNSKLSHMPDDIPKPKANDLSIDFA